MGRAGQRPRIYPITIEPRRTFRSAGRFFLEVGFRDSDVANRAASTAGPHGNGASELVAADAMIGAIVLVETGEINPRSVTIAVIRRAGVTSKAGL